MYLLDSNVISELRKKGTARVDPQVVHWEASVRVELLYVSVITLLELERGTLQAERRDPGQGRVLRFWLDEVVVPVFRSRTSPVSAEIALTCAGLHVPDKRSAYDALIAATALVYRMTVVTRNVEDFAPTGVGIVNPWVS